jgi:hypothetical protein
LILPRREVDGKIVPLTRQHLLLGGELAVNLNEKTDTSRLGAVPQADFRAKSGRFGRKLHGQQDDRPPAVRWMSQQPSRRNTPDLSVDDVDA